MTDKYLENTIETSQYSLWGDFIEKTFKLDAGYYKPRGYHWFYAFKYLSGIELDKIQNLLPEEHPLKNETSDDSDMMHRLKVLARDFAGALEKDKDIEYIKEIDFSALRFTNADFSFLVFPIKVSFAGSEFQKIANFNNALFFGDAARDVNKKVYKIEVTANSADFRGASFTKDVTFKNTAFTESVNFTKTNFDGRANFEGTIFHNVTVFCDTTFNFFTNFIGAVFFKVTTFSGTKFLSSVQFTNAAFFSPVGFDKIETKASAIFIKTQFLNSVPTFYDSKLYSNIIWEKDINYWPQIDGDKSNKNYKTKITDDQNAYENLASLMEKLDKYHDGHFFFRGEMRCRRWLASYPTKCFYWLYESLSDYGYGIERALLGWFLHIVLGAFLIGFATKNALCAFPVSFANAHGFLPFHKGSLSGCYELFVKNDIFNIIWGIQTIVGIILLFLVLLTLRIRFRLK